ncbi:hypothetical protein OSB04_016231 [Centaurea solstitialis]|uniref:SWIM-type domain-containing protein n=1 Tax=Centaurea solstitialis TaxID=347529 RepID=A0AA38WKV3_9ASTR|nr:hypothetical protein OSB04_016231 [Centaurea solstitialis]
MTIGNFANAIHSYSSIDLSNQCSTSQICDKNEILTEINVDSASDFNRDSGIHSANQSNRSEDVELIDDVIMEDCDVIPEMMDSLASSNVTNKDGFTVHIDVIPNVPEGVTPVVGTVFETIGHCIDMYKKYAFHVGFDIRRSTEHTFRDKSIRMKYLVCHRPGVPNKRSIDSTTDGKRRKALRNSSFKVTGCKAQVGFRRVKGTTQFLLYYFYPNHNHSLFDESDRLLSRNSRQMKFSDKMLVHRAARANIGALKAHQIQVCLKGGYEEVGCSKSHYKNYKRELESFIGDGDVQMVLNMFNERLVNGTNFAFEYKVSEGKLRGLFWADELSRFNYSEFGHVISFDATYRSNKHCMVFVPFLAIDNNKSSVVVGSGILCDEKRPSYTWLLEAFIKVHGSQPKVVLTDQDASIKEAFPIVFSESKHRLCMWHIMDKLPKMVSRDLLVSTDFRKRLLNLVWSVYLGPQEFEEKWKSLMIEFHLEGHPWLSQMSFAHHGNNLLTFILSHDSAMDKQRNRQRTDEHDTNTSVYAFKTNRLIKKHAAMLYTKKVFFDVQNEIVKGDRYCAQSNVIIEDGCQVFTIKEKDETLNTKLEFKVVQFLGDNTFKCSCEHFEYFGILCCHIFHVFYNIDVEEIPSKYVNRRWMRGVIPVDVLRSRLVNKAAKFEKFLGVSKPDKIDIRVVEDISNKGSGTGKRWTSGKERAIKNAQKKRKCKSCGVSKNHDSRNCPSKKRNTE